MTARVSVREVCYASLSVALMAVCSWISIPAAVPFTMQTFAVFACVGLLGTRLSVMAVCAYLLLGVCGAPVFAGFAGGPGAIIGPTGGYLVGFVLCALVSGRMIDRLGDRPWALAASMGVGLLICYAFGTAWFMFAYGRAHDMTVAATLGACVLPFVLPDCAKLALAISVTRRARAAVLRGMEK